MPSIDQQNQDEAKAAFIFTGKVVKSRSATIKDIPVEDTVIIQVDTITKVPAMFASLVGQQVTVRFKNLPELKEGTIITVFANGWIFGEGIAVDAVSFTEKTDKTELASMVKSVNTSNADSELKERLNSAELGVVGKVVKVEKAAVQEDAHTLAGIGALDAETPMEVETTHISEHDPDWHEATIQVDEVVKGQDDAKEVKVLFPKSDDVRWYNISKYKEGQQGIWLLQKGKTQNPNGIAPKVFAAIPADETKFTTLHAVDFLPLNELGRVKSMVNQ